MPGIGGGNRVTMCSLASSKERDLDNEYNTCNSHASQLVGLGWFAAVQGSKSGPLDLRLRRSVTSLQTTALINCHDPHVPLAPYLILRHWASSTLMTLADLIVRVLHLPGLAIKVLSYPGSPRTSLTRCPLPPLNFLRRPSIYYVVH